MQVSPVAHPQVPPHPSLAPQEPGVQVGVQLFWTHEGAPPGGTQQPETQVNPPGQTLSDAHES